METMKVVNLMSQEDISFIHDRVMNKNFSDFEQIGYGCFARVYKYKQYAIKVYRKKGDVHNRDGEYLEMLQDNPVFPKLYFHVPDKYVVMELIKGETLNTHISNHTLTKNLNLMPWLNSLKEYCATKRIVPNDFHTMNIMLDKEGILRIIDVGHYIQNQTVDLMEKGQLKDIIEKNTAGLERSLSFYFTYTCPA